MFADNFGQMVIVARGLKEREEVKRKARDEFANLRTLGDLARSEFFGLWRDRADIADSAAFARRLRAEAWSRAA